MIAFLVLVFVPPFVITDAARQATGVSRTCPSSWNVPATENKKTSKKARKQPENPGACVELSFSALEIQEYLQSYSRSKDWRLSEEHISDDSWTFSIGLSKDELLAATKARKESDKIEWRSGVARVQISSATLADGFARTTVRASFRGYGESADQFAPQRAYWELTSNGSFEASIVSALQTHFQSAR